MATAKYLMVAATALLVPAASAQTIIVPTATVSMSPEARSYLDSAITLFRRAHINTAKMDWPQLTAQAYSAAVGAKSTTDTYPAIWLVIKALGEKHTFFITPDQAKAQSTGKASNNAEPPPLLLPEGVRLPQGMGIIRLFGFSGSTEQGRQYAEFGQAKLKSLQAQGICKFVVDLRPNVGGNMYPMIDAVGGLLDEGVLGTFENVAGQFTPWVLKEGRTGTSATVASAPGPFTQVGNSVPVAVLIGPSTTSAGEYTAMSFKGRANTRFFGAPSGGYITANQPMPLSDGAVIIMTGAWGSDRTGKKYVDRMEPDEFTGAGGPALDAALDWLSRQRCAPKTKTKPR
jgi:hypothetical protein